jgi:hypothetical protein
LTPTWWTVSDREDQLPADATMSIEVDILPIADDNQESARLADLIEGVAGESSPFEELHEPHHGAEGGCRR